MRIYILSSIKQKGYIDNCLHRPSLPYTSFLKGGLQKQSDI